MEILDSDSQCVFRIILVEKLRFVRLNWNSLFEITYESKIGVSMIRKYHTHKTQTTPWHREEDKTDLNHLMQIITLLPVSKFYENLHA